MKKILIILAVLSMVACNNKTKEENAPATSQEVIREESPKTQEKVSEIKDVTLEKASEIKDATSEKASEIKDVSF